MNQNPRHDLGLSRRQLLKYSGFGVAAVAGSSFLAACGDDGGGGGGSGGGGTQPPVGPVPGVGAPDTGGGGDATPASPLIGTGLLAAGIALAAGEAVRRRREDAGR